MTYSDGEIDECSAADSKCHSTTRPTIFQNGGVHFYHDLAMATLQTAVDLFTTHSFHLVLCVFLVLLLYILYKSYWNPVIYIKDFVDIGFDHIPKGPHREVKIARDVRLRQVGVKLPPPYPNGWYALAESRELKKGGVTAVNVLGQNFCLYRGEDGVARCVDAYCPHLGANLGVHGRVKGNCIECLFHLWKFQEDGGCVSVPGLESPPRGIKLRVRPVVEANAVIWLWHDAEGRSPLWPLALHEELKSFGYRGRNEFIVGSHAMDIPENGADISHLNPTHGPSSLTTLGEKYPFLLNFIGHHLWTATWTAKAHEAVIDLHHEYRFGKYSCFQAGMVVTQMGPGTARIEVRTPLGPVLILQSVTPVEPLRQRVIHRFYSPWYNAPFGALLMMVEGKMFERDVRIWNQKRFEPSPAYAKTDKSVKAYRAWYTQFFSENSVTFENATRNNSLDW